jgi:uncharacterized protein YjiS (DUF1127 family)
MASSITPMVNDRGRLILSSWLSAAIRTISALSRAIGAGRARTEQRRALRELSDDDPHLLRDIGLTRQEAYREAAKWFWQR